MGKISLPETKNAAMCSKVHSDSNLKTFTNRRHVGVMSNCCFKYKLLEIFRLLSHADMHTIELSGTFHQVIM